MPDSSTQQSSGFGGALGGMRGWQAGTINSDISETMMGRMDLGGFSSISNWKPASEAIGAIPQQTNHMLHQTDEASQSNGVTTAQTNHYGQVTQMGGVSSHTGVTTAHANHNSQPSVQTGEASQSIQATTSQSNHNSQPAQTVGSSQSIGATTAQYDYNSQPTQTGGASQSKGATTAPYNHVTKSNQLNFPTIQHMVFSGPIHLKAHSPVDVSTMDPEIFAILQSILTPYLQETMGPTLHAYTLEVNYSPGHGKNVGKDVVETLIEVNCAFKVISDSVESFKSINHVQASRWIHDFFAGPEIYKLLEALRTDNIPVNDITFVDQAFQVSATVAEANSQMASGRYPVSKNNEKSSNGAFIGITLSVVIVGMIFFLHHTGRLPSKAQVGAFSLTARDSVAKHGATARHSIAKHSKSARKSIAKCIPSSMKRKESRLGKYTDDEVEGGRRRTYSGTFRRHPPGGLQKAALQKKPARSEEYLGESASTSSSSAGGAARSCRKSSSFTDMLEQDDYSFSNFEGDYEPSICAPSTPSRRTYNGDEASMTDTLGYDSSAHSRSLLDKVSNTVSQAASLLSPGNSSYKQQDASRSPIPSSAPRRVTAADIASPNDVDNWSIQSYQTKTPSRRSPSNHPLYRGWNDSGPELRMQKSEINDSEESPGRKRLNIPRFT
ncbi:unnamed protein product [Pseudo-nitzschia multistriata]|uniref:Uncharacterized protein n=1 Tax=Pseudo-nitzschia multistriata TaxID=183589 RepID=A0A448Z050_9STRA|nr:unnamed protein product [Pseudo-nitzschia multistriata]